MMGKATDTITTTAKYVGPCESGMRPGDVVMSDGTKMNIGDAQKKFAERKMIQNSKKAWKK